MAVDYKYYIHESDKAAMKALRAIPGFHQLVKAFMKVWSERNFRISNMSGCIRINENQLEKYYNMLPPICEKLGIEIPDLYLELDVYPNSYTSGDTKPFIVITSGLLETIPEELIPTVLAHECGHIACHHVLYTTMGSVLFGGSNLALRYLGPIGSAVSLPLQVAFYHWKRCSELSADRAAVICEGTAEKMSDVCMSLAGYDKDILEPANKEEFMKQAEEYQQMVKDSKWDKTLEFFALINSTHPLMAVRALECEQWGSSDQFERIQDGSYLLEEAPVAEEDIPVDEIEEEAKHSDQEKKGKPIFELPKIEMPNIQLQNLFGRKSSNEHSDENDPKEELYSAADEIRKYKELMDEGIITVAEFEAKKKQLLGI